MPLFSRPLVCGPCWLQRGLTLAFALGLATGAARADEFSLVPAGDPIYRQLSALDSADPTVIKVGAGLTRYEAALQVARIITRVTNDRKARLSGVGWRALLDLSVSLQSELQQLGIDVAAAQKLADAKIKEPVSASARVNIGGGGNDLGASSASGFGSAQRALPPSIVRGAAGDTLLSGASLGGGSSLLRPTPRTVALGLQSTEFSTSIVPRLRVGAALLAMQRAEKDPFQTSGRQALFSSGVNDRILGSDTSVNYDVTSWLSVRALSSRRELMGVPDDSPLLNDQIFAGATQARSAGGGVGLNFGALSFNTKIERLSTDAGARGTSLDGGVKLSAWQNRLSLSAHMARLQPEDRAVLPSTRAELNIGLKVSNRLDLNLFYQGLFTQQSVGNSGRVAGGLNLSF